MKSCLIALLLVVSSSALFAQTIPVGAVLFIEPGTLSQAIAAGILKKHVPVQLTTNREKADYILTATSVTDKEGTGERIAKVLVFGGFAGSGKSRDTSVTLATVDGTVVFAYTTNKVKPQSAAEGVAKHLKEAMAAK